jgi:hypothetical protein
MLRMASLSSWHHEFCHKILKKPVSNGHILKYISSIYIYLVLNKSHFENGPPPLKPPPTQKEIIHEKLLVMEILIYFKWITTRKLTKLGSASLTFSIGHPQSVSNSALHRSWQLTRNTVESNTAEATGCCN